MSRKLIPFSKYNTLCLIYKNYSNKFNQLQNIFQAFYDIEWT